MLAVGLGLVVGLGGLGVVVGLRPAVPSLESARLRWNRGVPADPAPGRIDRRVGAGVVDALDRSRWAGDGGAPALRAAAGITGEDLAAVAARSVVWAGSALVAPPVLWLVADATGRPVPLLAPMVLVLAAVPAGGLLPFARLLRRADERRGHARVVLGSFVDLVVLGLAGGVGVEGALLAAAQVTPDWMAARMARTLVVARDAGVAPWSALAALGDDLRLPELVELATTVQLAGTEGARIRATLAARAASLRRHEQADAETAANTATERLFLPGALLLVGFLVFIGFPAVQRILVGV